MAQAKELRKQLGANRDKLLLLFARFFGEPFRKLEQGHEVAFVAQAHEFHKLLKGFAHRIAVLVELGRKARLSAREFGQKLGMGSVDPCLFEAFCKDSARNRLDVVHLASRSDGAQHGILVVAEQEQKGSVQRFLNELEEFVGGSVVEALRKPQYDHFVAPAVGFKAQQPLNPRGFFDGNLHHLLLAAQEFNPIGGHGAGVLLDEFAELPEERRAGVFVVAPALAPNHRDNPMDVGVGKVG